MGSWTDLTLEEKYKVAKAFFKEGDLKKFEDRIEVFTLGGVWEPMELSSAGEEQSIDLLKKLSYRIVVTIICDNGEYWYVLGSGNDVHRGAVGYASFNHAVFWAAYFAVESGLVSQLANDKIRY